MANGSSLAFCTTAGPLQIVRRNKPVRGARRCNVVVLAAHPPRRVGAVAKDLRQALQLSLQSRMSRVDVRLPMGARLGTEKRQDPDDESLDTRRKSGDRELARVLAGMFEGTGLNSVVAFSSKYEREAAVKLWGPISFSVVSWDSGSGRTGNSRRRSQSSSKVKKQSGKGGFGPTLNEQKSEDPDVYITVGGGAGFLARVRSLAQSVGMDKLVIVANGNSLDDTLPVDLQRYFDDEFESVYHYQPNPHPQWNGGVLFRKFPDGMSSARLHLILYATILDKVPTFSCS